MVCRLAMVLLFVSALLAVPAQAGARWSKSYGEALRAASVTGHPLLLLFCPDDPKVVKTEMKHIDEVELASVFVLFANPVKIVNVTVSDPLLGTYVQGQFHLPFVAFTEGAGKLLHKLEGPQTSANLTAGMETALTKFGPLPNPKKAAEAAVQVKRADALFEKEQYGAAARLYQEIAKNKFKTSAVATAKEKLAKIEEMANGELAAARAYLKDKASYPEAIEKLFEIDRKYPTVKAGQEAHAELAKLRDLPEAKAAYDAAEKRAAGSAPGAAGAAKRATGPPLDPFTEEDLLALDEMGSPQAGQPSAAATAADPIEVCRRLFSTAQTWIEIKEPEKAKPLLQKIIEQYPKTLYADQAKVLLSEMK